MSAIISMT